MRLARLFFWKETWPPAEAEAEARPGLPSPEAKAADARGCLRFPRALPRNSSVLTLEIFFLLKKKIKRTTIATTTSALFLAHVYVLRSCI